MKRRNWIVLAALLGAGSAVGIEPDGIPWNGPVGSPAGPNVSPNCLAPWGVDLCEVTGINAAVGTPYVLHLAPIPVGWWWRPHVTGWVTNAPEGLPGLPLTYPEGYTPLYSDPAQDFIAKLARLTVEIDPATPQGRRYVFDNSAELAGIVPVATYFGPGGFFTPEWDDAAMIFYGYILEPLPPGVHRVNIYYTMSADHCDGLPVREGETWADHCLPPGELWMSTARYEFATR